MIKALRIRDFDDLKAISGYKNKVFAVILDSYSQESYGGTGKSFNWEIAERAKKYNIPIILAGGINPENVQLAVQRAQPFGIDVSSGVEVEKGIKDHKKMQKIFENSGKIFYSP